MNRQHFAVMSSVSLSVELCRSCVLLFTIILSYLRSYCQGRQPGVVGGPQCLDMSYSEAKIARMNIPNLSL